MSSHFLPKNLPIEKFGSPSSPMLLHSEKSSKLSGIPLLIVCVLAEVRFLSGIAAYSWSQSLKSLSRTSSSCGKKYIKKYP